MAGPMHSAAKNPRVYLRGLTAEYYALSDWRHRQREANRVIKSGMRSPSGHTGSSDESHARWVIGPADEPFLTQSLEVHFVEVEPLGANHVHGHQNEAAFYILQGRGHEVHDGKRYDWKKDDLVVVHTDAVHQHFNDSDSELFRALVMKAKGSWMELGLWQQGRCAPIADPEKYGPPQDWSQLWTPGVTERSKVMRSEDTRWETTRDGRVRRITGPNQPDFRLFSVDVYQQEVPVGSRSAKHWHMADEVLYVMSGEGYSLHWDVEAEILDKYYARIPNEPSRWEFSAGDVLYVPQNTIHQHFNASSQEPLVLLSAQNRLFRWLGYDNVAYLEDAPERAEQSAAVAVA